MLYYSRSTPGSVAEWLKAPHSKCGIGVTLSEVRILPLPPGFRKRGIVTTLLLDDLDDDTRRRLTERKRYSCAHCQYRWEIPALQSSTECPSCGGHWIVFDTAPDSQRDP